MTIPTSFVRVLVVAALVLASGCGGRGEPFVPFMDWGAPDAGPDVADFPVVPRDGDSPFLPEADGVDVAPPPDVPSSDAPPPADAPDVPILQDAQDVASPFDVPDLVVPRDVPAPDVNDVPPPPDAHDAFPPSDAHEVLSLPDDGPPNHGACTEDLGAALTTTFGRLDGILTSIVPPGTGGCNADESHLHLQVQMDGAVYDVAVNVGYTWFSDVYYGEWDGPLVDGAWDEGWHPDVSLDYVDLGVHSGDFVSTTQASLLEELDAMLAGANHVSVFGTAYGPDGAHLIHREGGGQDGAIVMDPLAPTSRFLLFRFEGQSF